MTRSTFTAATVAFLLALSIGTASARPGAGPASLHRGTGLTQVSRPELVPLPRPRPQPKSDLPDFGHLYNDQVGQARLGSPERADDLPQRS
jgi:hypothetical protein